MKAKTKEIKQFIQTWQNQGSEVADKVTYWNTLLEILGVPKEQIDNKTFIDYEKPIKLKENEHFHGSIDAYIPSTKVLIEQKSYGVDLFKEENRPNGHDEKPIKPFDQARRYDNHLPSREKANFLVLSNFSQIVVYDVRDSIDVKPLIIELKDLKEDLYLLDFLVKPDESKKLEKEQRVSVTAGELIGKIYDELSRIFAKYDQTDNEKIQHSINALCVRLVFCLYAEDAGLFPEKEQFYNYLAPIPANKCGVALRNLFKTLNTKEEDRTKDDPFWADENPELAQFPYTNGGLFADNSDDDIIIPPFTPELKKTILSEASKGFDWSDISPTIFGAVFESTLNPETRRQGGMHYTSIENIHKVIDPLFLDDLKKELEQIKQYKNQKTIKEKAIAFQEKLSNLTFFDPACGSGNFLTETFLSLRRLENEAIRLELSGESVLDVGQAGDWIHVSIQQFYGIEINDFAVSVAKTALWIAEDQMMKETQDLVYAPDWDFLPLKTYTKIHEGNALHMDWNKILPNYACHYVMGNPPFSGARQMGKPQKDDMKFVFGKHKGWRGLDYVAGWYIKASEYMKGTKIEGAFVSTNSITQGTQVPILWTYLLKQGVQINFAYRSFKWKNEAKDSANVICVIIGFSSFTKKGTKFIYDKDKKKIANNISPYLTDNQTIFISSRPKPITNNVPLMERGTTLLDGGYYLFKESQKAEFLQTEPKADSLFHPYYSSKDLLNNKPRYCLWLYNSDPSLLRKLPHVLERVKQVKTFRENGGQDARNFADRPLSPSRLCYYVKEHTKPALALPQTSSQRREYVPMRFVESNAICGSGVMLIENCSMYMFGILESVVHMAWMRALTGRLKEDYRYSSIMVYNNLPWLTPTLEQKEKIEKTAQAILDARANHSDNSLVDLYDPLLMPVELRKAHEANDKAVLEAYGLPIDTTESDIVAHLFKMYEKLTRNN
jgi:type I restriction-modification system DNA methylase subunit